MFVDAVDSLSEEEKLRLLPLLSNDFGLLRENADKTVVMEKGNIGSQKLILINKRGFFQAVVKTAGPIGSY